MRPCLMHDTKKITLQLYPGLLYSRLIQNAFAQNSTFSKYGIIGQSRKKYGRDINIDLFSWKECKTRYFFDYIFLNDLIFPQSNGVIIPVQITKCRTFCTLHFICKTQQRKHSCCCRKKLHKRISGTKKVLSINEHYFHVIHA